MKLRPVLIAEAAWATLTTTNKDAIAAETVERIADYPELAPLVRHQLEHAAKRLRERMPFRPTPVPRRHLAESAARLAR